MQKPKTMKIVILASVVLALLNFANGNNLNGQSPSETNKDYSNLPKKSGYPHSIQSWKYEGFDVGFCAIRKTPVWVTYNLGPNPHLYSFPRPSFRSDPNFRSISTLAYSKTGYDRGHMAPNYAIMTRYGRKGQNDSFYMTNMVPMEPSLNRGIWASFESIVARRYANELGRVWIVTGPIFDAKPEKLPSGVEIPDSFYKIVIDDLDSGPRALAIEMQNEKPTTKDWTRYLVSIDSIETKTGLDFFNELDDSMEAKLESEVALGIWGAIFPNHQARMRQNQLHPRRILALKMKITRSGRIKSKKRVFGLHPLAKLTIKPAGTMEPLR